MSTWKAVVGYEGIYEVSDAGVVRSIARMDKLGRCKQGVVLSAHKDSKGRLSVGLQGKTFRVSKLVAEAFLGPKPEGLECCHNNGKPSDNRASNLRWDTRSSNTKDAVAHGTNYEAAKTHCPQGHMLSGDNLVPWPLKTYGHRLCRECHNTKAREYYHRDKAPVAV